MLLVGPGDVLDEEAEVVGVAQGEEFAVGKGIAVWDQEDVEILLVLLLIPQKKQFSAQMCPFVLFLQVQHRSISPYFPSREPSFPIQLRRMPQLIHHIQDRHIRIYLDHTPQILHILHIEHRTPLFVQMLHCEDMRRDHPLIPLESPPDLLFLNNLLGDLHLHILDLPEVLLADVDQDVGCGCLGLV